MHTSTTSTARLDPWSCADLQRATQGVWLNDVQPDHAILRILTDSRQAKTGDAFLALKGERFDAHDFISAVAQQGASCAIVERAIEGLDLPQLLVKDCRIALGQLGAYRREQCQNLKVVALTGSSGKTTTKEMLGSIFARLGETLITRGNLNNDLGVPMMLLELRQDHRFAVLELGANHQGEIDYTANLVKPDVAGVINIGTAHMGEFGGREGICRAKSEIYAHIAPQGTAIIPQRDDFANDLANVAQNVKQQLRFGQGGDIFAENIELFAQSSRFDLVTPQGTIEIQLPFAGVHNVYNAEAAASFAFALGISLQDIQQGLAQAQGAKGRLNFIKKHRFTFIDDTYNANPTSMRMASEVLLQQDGIKIMVMGAIGELGEDVHREHFALGRDFAQKSLDYVIAVGEYAPDVLAGSAEIEQSRVQTIAVATQEQAIEFIEQLFTRYPEQMAVSCLFKGSRSAKMENVLNAVMEKV